jgi:16S rRNA processing protein RimM
MSGDAARSGAAARRARQEDRIAVGHIRRAHGLHGFVRFESLSGEIDHFPSIREVELRGRGQPARRYEVESFRLSAPTLLMKLGGVDDRDAAAVLAGREIWVERRHAAPLGPDEYYLADLAGCELQQDGRTIGTVRSVLEAGAGDVLEAVHADGRTLLIPFRHQYVRSADVDAGVIELTSDAVVE